MNVAFSFLRWLMSARPLYGYLQNICEHAPQEMLLEVYCAKRRSQIVSEKYSHRPRLVGW
jgi:hypothetical protein